MSLNSSRVLRATVALLPLSLSACRYTDYQELADRVEAFGGEVVATRDGLSGLPSPSLRAAYDRARAEFNGMIDIVIEELAKHAPAAAATPKLSASVRRARDECQAFIDAARAAPAAKGAEEAIGLAFSAIQELVASINEARRASILKTLERARLPEWK